MGALSGLRYYRVQPRDTLPGISTKFYGSDQYGMYIWEANRHYVNNPNQLATGQMIAIPHLDTSMAAEHLLGKLLA